MRERGARGEEPAASVPFAEERVRGGTRSLAAPSRNVLEEHLNPHPEFHSSVQGTGKARKDRMGHFQQTHSTFLTALSQQSWLPPSPSAFTSHIAFY